MTEVGRRPTIRDISVEAGVSTFSVSQALSGKGGVGGATRERVLRIAAELGYLPNKLAANLKDASTSTVGVLTASGRNQYYAVLAQAIDSELQGQGFHLVSNDALRGETYSAEAERAGVKELIQQRVAAVIATYSLNPESIELLERWDIPVVFADSLPPESARDYAFVGVDNERASEQVLNYLADLGHRRVAFLGYPNDWNTRIPREAGFRAAARRRGVEVETLESLNSADGAQHAVRELLQRDRASWPTAIYATNTLLLQGALKELRRRSVRIPADMSVVGFDEFDWAELVDPPMTVVNQHIADVGSAAGRTVLQAIASRREGAREHPAPILIEATLLIRESCARPRS